MNNTFKYLEDDEIIIDENATNLFQEYRKCNQYGKHFDISDNPRVAIQENNKFPKGMLINRNPWKYQKRVHCMSCLGLEYKVYQDVTNGKQYCWLCVRNLIWIVDDKMDIGPDMS